MDKRVREIEVSEIKSCILGTALVKIPILCSQQSPFKTIWRDLLFGERANIHRYQIDSKSRWWTGQAYQSHLVDFVSLFSF